MPAIMITWHVVDTGLLKNVQVIKKVKMFMIMLMT